MARKYMTEQRKLLYDFFKANPHKPFSARKIHEALSDHDISLSAVYRNLDALKKEDLVRCHINPDSKDLYYQFIDRCGCGDAIHVTCLDCGKTFHMKTDAAQYVQDSLAQAAGFRINSARTVLYGTCRECAAGE